MFVKGMKKKPTVVEVLLRRYGKKTEEKTVFERSEGEFQDFKKWTERMNGGAGVVAKKDGKFVLAKNTGQRYWSFPGGGVEHGEDFEEAAVREFKEETGLDVKVTDLIAVYEHIHRSPRRETLTFYMAVFEGVVTGGEMEPNPGEISELRLFDEVPFEELIPWVRRNELFDASRLKQKL